MSINYKVVETMDVSDASIELILNDMGLKGWSLESIHFAMKENSKRPAMAFLIFSRVRQKGEKKQDV